MPCFRCRVQVPPGPRPRARALAACKCLQLQATPLALSFHVSFRCLDGPGGIRCVHVGEGGGGGVFLLKLAIPLSLKVAIRQSAHLPCLARWGV